MLRRLAVFVGLAIFATAVFAKDAFVPIAGSAGSFRTDARIFNPSQTKDITVQAFYLPVGNGDNSAVQAVSFPVPHRQMLIYNDVVSTLLHASGLGGIRFTSSDDFSVTERAYSTTNANSCSASGTLGLSVEAYDSSEAMSAGVLLQLTAKPSFHTNIGAINTNNATVNVTWRLYDKSNNLVATSTKAMPPYAVVAPTNMTSFFAAGSADITDAWVSFTSDQPIIAYASINDDVTTDPTYIPMLTDSGSGSSATGKVFDVTLKSFQITISPAIGPQTLKVGDKVTFRIQNTTTDGVTHGFTLGAVTSGAILIPDRMYPPGSGIVEQTWTVPAQGTYAYTCTNTTCGTGNPGHTNMNGTFDVGQPSDGDPGGKY
jgi:hypothetical protein